MFWDKNTSQYRDCQSSKETNWMPEDGCIFLPNIKQKPNLNTSMLSYYYLNQVITLSHFYILSLYLSRHTIFLKW